MRRGKFCPKCGKTAEKLHEGLCKDCFGLKIDLPEDFPEHIKTGTCKRCGNVYISDIKEKFNSVEGAIEFFLRKVLNEEGIKDATYRISGNTMFVTVKMDVNDVEKSIDSEIPLTHKTITCELCALRNSKYYNATLQVRVPKAKMEKILDEIYNQIDKIGRNDNFSFISKTVELKEGVDLYVGSKSAANKVVSYLKKKYGIKTKLSRTLFGPVQGKKVYRDTILISLDK